MHHFRFGHKQTNYSDIIIRLWIDRGDHSVFIPNKPKRVLQRVLKENSSGWLNMGPSKREGFDLSAEMFRDTLDVRYGKEPRCLPGKCDGCGENFNLEHALNCKKGGNVKHGHDQMRDECALLTEMAYGKVTIEPF